MCSAWTRSWSALRSMTTACIHQTRSSTSPHSTRVPAAGRAFSQRWRSEGSSKRNSSDYFSSIMARASGPSSTCLVVIAGSPAFAGDDICMASRSINHDAADRLAFMHQVEAVVDVGEPQGMGDHRVDLDLALHVPVDDARHVGAPARAAEGGPFPHPPGDELERPR